MTSTLERPTNVSYEDTDNEVEDELATVPTAEKVGKKATALTHEYVAAFESLRPYDDNEPYETIGFGD